MSQPSIPPRPPYDPAYKGACGIPKSSSEPFTSIVETSRKTADADSAEDVLAKHPHLTHTDITIPAIADLDNNAITLAIFQTKTSANKRRSAVFYVHGGGQIVGNRFHMLAQWFDLVLPLNDGLVCASVEYRRAPEDPAPAGAHDTYAALMYLSKHSEDLGIDASKILIYGISGGAPLAASACLLARNRRCANPCAQLLSVPMLDDREHWPSFVQFESHTLWPGFLDRQAWDMVLGEDRHNGSDVDAIRCPGRASDLSNLPPTYIDVGECEVFRDSAVDFAGRIWRGAGSVELHVWAGMYHGGLVFEPSVLVSKAALEMQRRFIERALGLRSGCLSKGEGGDVSVEGSET
ncbi:alpha/beta-hydrolase [Decorospora gaudefroyi]|uniref:Alpha/beta-hydrolase n=1 Tax=Decorospora gaudefroyi TaxID=184978 RepID=A0A6A5KJY9_9PLEO|nr:alpha/beta-hydrolase [Decorospora gaudefroyi]